MQTSLFTGISGLNANMSSLSIIGNNIANVNTIGFKASRATFADILSQSIEGVASPKQIGLGVTMSSIEKIFSQGAFETTSSGLDLAISGSGFFILKDSTGTFYSRAGQFHIDREGYLVNPEGLKVQGYMANASGVLQNTITDIQLSTSAIGPNPTSTVSITANLNSNAPITGYVFTLGSNDTIRFSVDGGTTWINASLISDGGLTAGLAYDGGSVAAAIKNALEARNGNADKYTVDYDDQRGVYTITNDTGNTATLTIDWTGSNSASLLGFDPATTDTIAVGSSASSDNAGGAFFLSNAGETSNFSVPLTVYDSLGNDHLVTLYFRKDSLTSTGNTWEWFAVVNDTDTYSGNTEIQAQGTITFNTDGALYIESGITYPTGGFDFAGGSQLDQIIDFEFGTSIAEGGKGTDGVTQYGVASGVSSLTQDGYAAGSLQRISVNQEGIIEGIFSNGRSRVLAQILLADFPSEVGLASAGKNLYSETYDSGQPLVGSPGTSGRGYIQTNTLELSNVDIAQEFVNMITAQRGFQANSRIILTTDEILGELVNLKR